MPKRVDLSVLSECTVGNVTSDMSLIQRSTSQLYLFMELYMYVFSVRRSKKKKVKVRFMGLFQHCGRSAYCILTPNKFPHSSPEAPRIIQMRETSTSEGGNYYQ